MGDRIASLPKDIRSLLRTGVAITSAAQCVEELVTNALDAGATCVAIRVDLSCFKIQVVDNGKGIKLDDLPLIGERYATSKCHEVSDLENLCYFGYRGEAIASLCDISNIIEINSRPNNSTQTYCKIFQQGKALAVSESTLPRSSSGTTITVHDLFYNLPVRRKCCNQTLEFEKIRQKVESIALIKPSISFTLRNDVTGQVVLQTHKTNSVLNTFNYLFSPGRGAGLTEITGREGDFVVDGYVSKKGCNKKDYQFIYINGRNVLKTKLHKIINHHLSKSLILRKKLELTTNKFRGRVMTTSPTKTTDQHAIYVLNIMCPYKEYDITFEPAKTLVEFRNYETLQQCLEKTIINFLKEHNLHLGILVEDFQKRGFNSKDADEYDDDDGQLPSSSSGTENVGLKPKYDIKTTDRNGLFSKVVKRKIIQDVTSESVESTESETPNDETKESERVESSEEAKNSESKRDECVTPADQQLKAKIPSTPELNKHLTHMESTSSISVESSFNPSSSSESKNNENWQEAGGELSEDPLPSHQNSQLSKSIKKKIICLDTPLVREAKINVSSLSKLRKRRNLEECPFSPKSPKGPERLISFTKLRENSNFSDIQEKKRTNGKNDELSLQNCISQTSDSSSKPYMSSLLKLRNLRSNGETSKHSNETSQLSNIFFKSSLQELKKFKAQTPNFTISDNDQNGLSFETLCDNQCNISSNESSKDRGNALRNQPFVHFDSLNNLAEDAAQKCDKLESTQSDQILKSSNTSLSMNGSTITDIFTAGNESGNNVVSVMSAASDSGNHDFVEKESCSTIIDSDYEPQKDSSSPIDIDKACDAIDNCVAEIEIIISNTRTCNDNLLSTHTSTSDIECEPLEATRRSDINNSNQIKSFMTSENLFHTAQSYLPVQESHTGKPPSDVLDVGTRNDSINKQESEVLVMKNDSPRCGNTIDDTCEISEKVNSSTLEVCDSEPEMIVNSTRDNTVLSNKSRDSDNDAISYHSNQFESIFRTQNASDVGKTSVSQLNYETTYMSYFDIKDTQSNELTMEIVDHGRRNYENLPFECYMEHMGKTIIANSDSEVDESLICTESISDMDDTEAYDSHTQEFSVSRDSGLLMDCHDMDTTDFEDSGGSKFSVPVFRPRSISPCLSEGFCPEIESDGFSPAIDVWELSSINSDRGTLHCDSNTVNDLENHKFQSLSQKLRISMDKKSHQENSGSSYFSTIKSSLSNTNSYCTGQNETEKRNEMKTVYGDKSYDNSTDLFCDSPTSESNESGSNCVEQTNSGDEDIHKSLTYEKSIENDNFCLSITNRKGESVPGSVVSESHFKASDNFSYEVYSDTLPKTPEAIIGDEVSPHLFSPEGDIAIAENGSQPNDCSRRITSSSSIESEENNDECFSPDGDSQLRSVQIESKTWIQIKDPKSGEILHVNTRSGNSINSTEFTPPEDVELHSKKDVTELNTPVSTGRKIVPLSPDSSRSIRLMLKNQLSKEDDDLSSVKWKDKIDSTQKVEDLFKEWENPVFNMPHKSLPSAQVNLMSRASSKAYKALNPCVFDKEMLQNFKVLGQVDNKFIACSLQATDGRKGEDMLVLIDQHAAHERIRLEKFTQDIYEVQIDNKVISCTDLVLPEEINLPEDIIRVITSFTEEFKRIGVKFTWEKKTRDKVTLQSVPTCFLPKDHNNGKRNKETTAIKSTQTLIKEYAEVLQDTRGSRGRLPSTIHRVLCSQACHGAIKFGDPLSLVECEELLKDLTQCKLPFQCAHGRPSVVPLIQLGGRTEERKRPNLWKIAKYLQQ